MSPRKLFLCFAFTATAFCVLSLQQLKAQWQRVEQITMFSSRMHDPLKIEMFQQGEEYRLTANNSSYYPYEVTIKFSHLKNLRPTFVERTFYVEPGSHLLQSFRRFDKNVDVGWQYNSQYRLTLHKATYDSNFPYLFPVSEDAGFLNPCKCDEKLPCFYDRFLIEEGDTVFCIRKGYVTALPYMEKIDRLGKKSTLEVRHRDGSIMLYMPIYGDNFKPLVNPGACVYPGEPLGVVTEESFLQLSLYHLFDERISALPIKYHTPKGLLLYDAIPHADKVSKAEEIITREMSKREKRRLKKGKLY